MKKRPHVDHDWKDRTLKLVETKREMQERIDNLSTALDEEVMTSRSLFNRNTELLGENSDLYDCIKRMAIWLSASVVINITLVITLAVMYWRG